MLISGVRFHIVPGLILATVSWLIAVPLALCAWQLATVEHVDLAPNPDSEFLWLGYHAPGSTSIHPLFLRASGIFLFAIAFMHVFPFSLIATRHQLRNFAVMAVLLPVLFAGLYCRAEWHDPIPVSYVTETVGLAWLLAVVPLLRAGTRSIGLRPTG